MSLLLEKKLRGEKARLLSLLPSFPERRIRAHQLDYVSVLDAHFAIADYFFREDYGMAGVGFRDVGLFVSTVERQFSQYGGKNLLDNEYEEIASLLVGIIRNHPFFDANKRTGFLCALLQLHGMGRAITVPEKEFEDLMVEIAEGNLLRYSRYKDLRKAGVERPDIKYLAWYLRKKSRATSRLSAAIKFRDMRRILEANGFSFASSIRGTIDVLKVEERRVPRFFFGDRIERANKVIINIAYHGEGVDVPANTVKAVRQACGLTDQDGFDGEVLLRDAEPTFRLIKSYRAALQSLAYR